MKVFSLLLFVSVVAFNPSVDAAALLVTNSNSNAKESLPPKPPEGAPREAPPAPSKEAPKELVDEEGVRRFPGTTAIALNAKQVILLDVGTGKVLLEKNAHERMAPSSMSKMMTSYLIEEKLKKGEAAPDTMLPVSEKAWRMGGSKMFVPLGESIRLDDLLKGIIIVSGNDACIVAAEGLWGSEEQCVDVMNAKAKEFGMTGTHFANTSGWPDPGHYSTAADLALLGMHIIKDHPAYYPLYSEKNFTFGKNNKGQPITQGNRNPLLYKDMDVDGIKTGHTEDGGYGIILAYKTNGQRCILVINGLKSMKERAQEATKILTWARQNFINKKVYTKGDVVEKAAPVWLGTQDTIPLIVDEDVNVFLPRAEQNKASVKVHFESPLPAPIKKGDRVGKVIVTLGAETSEVPLIAAEASEKVGLFTRLQRSITYLIFGKA